MTNQKKLTVFLTNENLSLLFSFEHLALFANLTHFSYFKTVFASFTIQEPNIKELFLSPLAELPFTNPSYLLLLLFSLHHPDQPLRHPTFL